MQAQPTLLLPMLLAAAKLWTTLFQLQALLNGGPKETTCHYKKSRLVNQLPFLPQTTLRIQFLNSCDIGTLIMR